MRVLEPTGRVSMPRAQLAPRPASLDGKIVGVLDGWAGRHPDRPDERYPLLVALAVQLERAHHLAGVRWYAKPFVSRPVPEETLRRIAREVDVVLNGECL